MIKIRNKCFETNSSSTHALIVSNDDFLNWKVEDDISKLPIFNLEESINMFTYGSQDCNVYEGTFTDIKDKLRYLYTVLIQANLYTKDSNDNIVVDRDSDAYKIFKDLNILFPKVTFVVPEDSYYYVFEDCEWLVDEILKSEYLTTLRGLVLFFLRGRVQYCDRDSDILLNESLYNEVKENFLCSVICSG